MRGDGEHLVAGRVSQGVVDAFEPIQIQEQHPSRARSIAEPFLGLPLQRQPVGQLRQLVACRQPLQLQACVARLGDVDELRHVVQGIVVLVTQQRDRVLHPDFASVQSAQTLLGGHGVFFSGQDDPAHRQVAGVVVGVQHAHQGLPDKVVRLSVEHVAQGVVNLEKSPIQRHHRHPDRGRPHGQREPALAFQSPALRGFDVGDVRGDQYATDDAPVVGKHRTRAQQVLPRAVR